MSRPRRHDSRTATAVRFPPELLARLQQAAAERDLSANYLVNRAVEEFLDRLIPVDEIRWTREDA
jgi:predicted transcriptional regulator